MTRKLLLLTFLCITRINANAQSMFPDVVHYDITLDTLNYTTKSIRGHCAVIFTAGTSGPLAQLELGLLQLNIDSIRDASANILSFNYNDTLLQVTLPGTIGVADTDTVIIYYSGAPQTDPSGWGGFYFNGNYAFNLGVGFGSNPHTFGRAWFPANDLFTDRATYTYHITTSATNKAFCNGTLTAAVVQPGGEITWHWDMNDPIPTYLASMAVAPYYTFGRNYQGIPVEIACMAQDTNNVIGTFQHLDTVLGFYINAYGPYPFDKVGYCLVPFNSGAMEHATSIHIGTAYINGSLSYETLWAHELAHMWWGDWTTCETEGDMWLNEGFASFNEAYITEKLYGIAAYRAWIRSNHRKVLQFAHINDGGYLPLINIPHEHTYGQTVYNKGADVAHTLRHYLGDSLFFEACRNFMSNKGNGAVNSNDLRDELSNSSGISMNRFFDDWVFTPGFPHFSIDSVETINASSYQYQVHLRQKSKGNNYVYEMPVEVNFSDGISDTTLLLLSNNVTNAIPVTLNFNPTWVSVDRFDHMSDAISDCEKQVYSLGTQTFPETYFSMNVLNAGQDTSTIRVEHHWVIPDPFKSGSAGAGIRLSNYRYWSVDGILSSGLYSKATFNYNGSNNPNAGYMDNTFITGTEDSLIILYRRGAGDDWSIVNGYTLNTGNKFDKVGTIVIDTLRKGEYTLAYRDYTTGISSPGLQGPLELQIWPNPSTGSVNFSTKGFYDQPCLLTIFDSGGRNIFNTILQNQEVYTWSPETIKSGTFVARVVAGQEELSNKLFQIIP